MMTLLIKMCNASEVKINITSLGCPNVRPKIYVCV